MDKTDIEQNCDDVWEAMRPIGGTFWHELDERTRALAVACYKDALSSRTSPEPGEVKPVAWGNALSIAHTQEPAEAGPNPDPRDPPYVEPFRTLYATVMVSAIGGANRHYARGKADFARRILPLIKQLSEILEIKP